MISNKLYGILQGIGCKIFKCRSWKKDPLNKDNFICFYCGKIEKRKKVFAMALRRKQKRQQTVEKIKKIFNC